MWMVVYPVCCNQELHPKCTVCFKHKTTKDHGMHFVHCKLKEHEYVCVTRLLACYFLLHTLSLQVIFMKYINYFECLVVKNSLKLYQFFKPRDLVLYNFLPLVYLTNALMSLSKVAWYSDSKPVLVVTRDRQSP